MIIAKRHKPVAVVVELDRYRQAREADKRLTRIKGKRILKIRGIARGATDIDDAISALVNREQRLLLALFKMLIATDTHALVYHVIGQSRRLGRRAKVVFDRIERGLDTPLIPFTVLEEVML